VAGTCDEGGGVTAAVYATRSGPAGDVRIGDGQELAAVFERVD
jgi:hypothetical protein